jgi:hypothetical protein
MSKREMRQVNAGKRSFNLARFNHLRIPESYVNQVSLSNHLALVACCVPAGNKDLLNRLSSVLYLCFLIWEAEGGGAHINVFRNAEKVLDAAIRRAMESNVWRLEEPDRGILARLLMIHDKQLVSISTRACVSAVEQLDRLLTRKDPVSPLSGRSTC